MLSHPETQSTQSRVQSLLHSSKVIYADMRQRRQSNRVWTLINFIIINIIQNEIIGTKLFDLWFSHFNISCAGWSQFYYFRWLRQKSCLFEEFRNCYLINLKHHIDLVKVDKLNDMKSRAYYNTLFQIFPKFTNTAK